MKTTNPISLWHESLKSNNPSIIYNMLSDDFEFFSPALFKSKDKYMGFIYLMAAHETFLTSSFNYVSDIRDENPAVLEFECEIDGVHINGIDMFKWNDENKLTEMKVMIRTDKALKQVIATMTGHLSRPEIWR